MPYIVELECTEDGQYKRSLLEEMAWAIGHGLRRGLKAFTMKLIVHEVADKTRVMRDYFTEQSSYWVPPSLATRPAQNWSDNDVLRACMGNAAIRAKAGLATHLDQDENHVRVFPSTDGTYTCIRLVLPAEVAVPAEARVRVSG